MSQTFSGEGGMIASLLPQQQQMVYGLDGTAYPSADAARASGVFDFRYAPPMAAVPTAMPMATADASSFVMPAARGSFNPAAMRGSGLLGDLGAGSGLISGGAGLMGDVPMYGRTWNVPDYLAPAAVQRSQAMGLMGNVGGGGSDYSDPNPGWSSLSDAEKAAYYAENPTMAAITRAGQTAFGYAFPGIAAAQEYMSPGFAPNQRAIASGDGYFSSQGGGSRGESWQNAPADMGITAAPSSGQGYMADNSIEMGGGYSGVGGGAVGSIDNSMSQSDALNAQEAGMGVTNDGTYCCSRMVDLNLWSEHKQLARMHVWHHKQAKWWRAGYSVWGKVVANTLFKKKGFWTNVMDDFYNYHVKNKPRTIKSTVGDLVIYPGVAVCSLFVHEAPTTTRYVAQ